MQSLYDVPAPAKVNLFLHITGRRDDGYHLLQSAFMLLDWCDTLHFSLRSDGAISREDLSWTLPEQDLIVRAAQALKQATHYPLGAHISVHKSIPAQAGLGGGSSDAASTLLALNRLWKLHLPVQALARIGLALGADVPFFLSGANAWVQGIGESISPLTLPHARFVVVKPSAGLETRLIFSDPALKRDTKPATISHFAADTFGFGRNDLQAVAERQCPEVAQAIAWLAQQGLIARMTGSGSAVFAQMPHPVDFLDPPSGYTIQQCSNLLEHPLAGWASSNGSSVDGE